MNHATTIPVVIPYPQDERIKRRETVKRLTQNAERVRKSIIKAKKLPADLIKMLTAITNTGDPEGQMKVLYALAETHQATHIQRLKNVAKDDFAAFCEVMSPSEPPDSPWLVFLTGVLQAIEDDSLLDNPHVARVAASQGMTQVNNLLLNVPPGHAKPLHVDTMVTMGDGGRKRLGDVEQGDLVITHTGHARRVTAVHKQGVLPLVKIATDQGRVILSAKDHPFKRYDQDDYVNAGDLQPGDDLDIGVWRSTPKNIRFDPALVRYMAFVDATCAVAPPAVNKAGKSIPAAVRFHTQSRLVIDRARADAEAINIDMSVYPNRGKAGYIAMVKARSRDKLLTYTDMFIGAVNREVTPFIFNGSNAMTALYLKTVFDCKARFSKQNRFPGLQLYAHSLSWVKQLQTMLARLGVPSTLDMPEEGFAGQPALYLDHSASLRYLYAVGEFEGVNALEFAQKVEQHKTAPAARMADTVRIVETAGKGECRCLTVEEDHTFLAEGLVVHNSTYASRLYPAWRFGRDPDMKVLGAGHTQNFVEKEFSKRIRDMLQSPEYRSIFPALAIDHASRANDAWNIAGHRGQYVARGVGQAIHGFRFNFALIDDPYPSIAKAKSAAYREEVRTFVLGDIGTRMLPNGKTFVIMTRFHAEDVTSTILELNERLAPEDRFLHLSVPAVCYDEDLDIMGRALGELLWPFYGHSHFVNQREKLGYQQYSLTVQQITTATNPDSIGGKFCYYKVLPHLEPSALAEAPRDKDGRPIPQRASHFRRIVMSVDTASKETQRADYTVGQVWGETGDHKHYLIDQIRFKAEFNGMIAQIERMANNHKVDVILVEDKGQGTAYLQARGRTDYQRRQAPAPLVPINPGTQSKSFRFDSVAPLIEAGEVYLPENAKWIDAFMVEVGQFPDGAHDDQVDAMTQYLQYARSKRTRFGSKKVGSYG